MQRKSSVRLGISVLLTAGVAAAAASLSPVVAAPADQAPAPGESVVTGLQHDLGLGEQEARERLKQEAAAVKVESEARRAAGKALGGSWFDAESGKLVVGLTDKAKSDAVRATGAATEIVPNTVAELDATKAELDAEAEKKDVPEGVYSWHVDPRSSSVVVTVDEDAADDADIRAFLRDAEAQGAVTIEEAAHEAPDTFAAGTVGGDAYYINGNTRCSIGFSVHGGFVTAGHCGGVGSSAVGWDGSAMGTFEGSSFPGNDYAFVRIGHGWWTEPVVLGWEARSDVLVRGSNEAPVGASICRSGSTTHWHCGTVLAKNQTVIYGGDTYVHELTKTTVCAEPGDSGGSYISGDQAQGVTSGGWGNCSSGGETWYQPVNEILNVYGLTLHTA